MQNCAPYLINLDGGGLMIWLIISVIFATLFLYPYVIYPKILPFIEKVELCDPQGKAANNLKFALFFSAYNEEETISRTIAWLRELKSLWAEIEIFAYDDMSSDQTGIILDKASDVLTVVHGKERMGKPNGLRQLIAKSKADIGIFIDANVVGHPSSMLNFIHYFSDPKIGTVAAKLTSPLRCVVYSPDLEGGEGSVSCQCIFFFFLVLQL